MRTQRVKNLQALLDPTAAGWAGIDPERVPMIPIPLPMQPTEYIRNAWQGRDYGKIDALTVASAHDGKAWALRAEWEGVSPAGGDFPDALAIALPVRGEPALVLMGAADAPLHFLRWQSNKEGADSQIATGIGKTLAGPAIDAQAWAAAAGGRWSVVVSRPLGGGDVAPLAAGSKTRIGFAVWRGANDERGGIKAFSIDWAELALDA